MSKEVATLLFRILAGIATVGLASSPALLMIRIYKQKHVGVASVFPLAALLGSSHVWVVYGYLTRNFFPLVSCFLYGESLLTVEAVVCTALPWRKSSKCLNLDDLLVFKVFKHKSAVFINVHMVIAGLASNIVWLTYGILITNPFIMCLNAFSLLANVITLLLYLVYDPKTHPLKDWRDEEQKVPAVCIVIPPLGDPTTPKTSFSSLPSPEFTNAES